MADARAVMHRLQNVEVTRVPCCTPEVAETQDIVLLDLTRLNRSISQVIMSDRDNVDTGLAPHELYQKSNPGLLKIDVTNPREWYKNGERIITTFYDKNTGRRSLKGNRRHSLDSGVKSSGGLLLPSVHENRSEADRSTSKRENGRSNRGAKAFPFLNHVTHYRYISEPSLNVVNMNGSMDRDEDNVGLWTENKENAPEEDQTFVKQNGRPSPRNGHARNGTVSDSELDTVMFHKKKKHRGVGNVGFRGGLESVMGKTNNTHSKQRNILHDTIKFEQYKLKQKSMLKLKFPDSSPTLKTKPRPYVYSFQHAVPQELDYSHIESKIGPLIGLHSQHGTVPPNEEATVPNSVSDTTVRAVNPKSGLNSANVRHSFGLDILNDQDQAMPSTTPSVKEGHYVYKAPGDGYYQRSLSLTHDGPRTAIVNLALSKDVRSTPSDGLTPSLSGRSRRRRASRGNTNSTPGIEYLSSLDDGSIFDYETDDETIRSLGPSRATTGRYTSIKSAASMASDKTQFTTKNAENRDSEAQSGEYREDFRLDSPSKKSVRFSQADGKDGSTPHPKSGFAKNKPVKQKSVLKKFNKIEVFGEVCSKKSPREEQSYQQNGEFSEPVATASKPSTATARPPVYKLDKSLSSKSGEEDDEFMTRVARLGSPTESKMVEIVESYRRYLDNGNSEDPTPRTVAGAGTADNVQPTEHEARQNGVEVEARLEPSPKHEEATVEADKELSPGQEDAKTKAGNELSPKQEDPKTKAGNELSPEQEDAPTEAGKELSREQEDATAEVAKERSPEQEDATAEAEKELSPEQEDATTEAGKELSPEQEDAMVEAGDELSPEQEDATTEAGKELSAEKEDATTEAGKELSPEQEDTTTEANAIPEGQYFEENGVASDATKIEEMKNNVEEREQNYQEAKLDDDVEIEKDADKQNDQEGNFVEDIEIEKEAVGVDKEPPTNPQEGETEDQSKTVNNEAGEVCPDAVDQNEEND